MALNFPDSPTLNQVYTDATSGFSYKWNGTVWTSFESSTASNIQELDDISGSFNGVTTTFALTIGGQSITPVTTNQLVISVGGVMQNPTNDFYISGSNIVFTTAPASGLTFFGTLLGTALSLNTIADGSVTPLKLSTGGPSWNTGGDVVITGTGTTALLVNGNARVTGILTVGTGSITLNGSTDRITVGTGLTLSSSGIIAGGLIVTAGVSTLGVITSGNIYSTGIVTASSFSGSALSISGISTANDTRILSVGEKTTRVNGNTASLVYNTGGGNIAICTNPTGDITLSVSGIPTDNSFNDNSITFSVCVNQTGIARSCTAVILNGFNATIRWAGGSLSNAIAGVTTSSGMDIYSFTGINTIGSASTTTNYYLLGVVNGGYR